MKRKDAAQEVPRSRGVRNRFAIRDARKRASIAATARLASRPWPRHFAYQSDAKNPAYAPAVPREDLGLWFAELAAA